MSQENVEIARTAFGALSRGDLPSFLANVDAAVEWWDRPDALDPQVFRGHEGIERLVAGVVEAFSGWRTEATDFVDAGEYVVMPIHHVGRGRSSDIPVNEYEAYACRLREGKIVEVREYKHAAEALDAVARRE